jgi:hypothetical protein
MIAYLLPLASYVSLLLYLVTLLRLRLVREKKIFGVTSDVSEVCREGFSDTNKKTNYRTRQDTARRI